VKSGSGSWQLYYICRDYLGSITHITNAAGTLYYQYSYDAWGRLRNPSTQTVYEPGSEPSLFLGRGYTGHEHLPQFGLINMNARLYDPALGRFLAPDPYVQNPFLSQSFNRYSYCLNNPLKYTDPNGESFWDVLKYVFTRGNVAALMISTGMGLYPVLDASTGGLFTATYATVFPFTSQSYDLQKYISPIAVNFSPAISNERFSIDFDISGGTPLLGAPVGSRSNLGFSYVFNDYDNMYTGLEGRYGVEFGMNTFTYTGLAYTRYDRQGSEYDQWRNMMTIGSPLAPLRVQNDNDMLFFVGGGTDMYYTQGTRVSFLGGLMDIGLDVVTGRGTSWTDDGVGSPYGYYDIELNKHRTGILSFRFGSFRFGYNSESIRNYFQNGLHDVIGSPRYPIDTTRKGRWFWELFGW
jgi:RHS repeat-associated protein